jgi:hypothetical protein
MQMFTASLVLLCFYYKLHSITRTRTYIYTSYYVYCQSYSVMFLLQACNSRAVDMVYRLPKRQCVLL